MCRLKFNEKQLVIQRTLVIVPIFIVVSRFTHILFKNMQFTVLKQTTLSILTWILSLKFCHDQSYMLVWKDPNNLRNSLGQKQRNVCMAVFLDQELCSRNWSHMLLIFFFLLEGSINSLQIAIKLYTAILRDIRHRLKELDFLFFDFDAIYERFKTVA